jgi:hypothetical protein
MVMARMYRKKPVVIEAYQLVETEYSVKEAVKFAFGVDIEDDMMETMFTIAYQNGGLFIETLEGTMKADFGDYIIRGIKGEVYPCKPDIFEATYELVEG